MIGFCKNRLALMIGMTMLLPIQFIQAQTSPETARLHRLQRDAQAGLATAQSDLADSLYEKKDYSQAARYFYQAAVQGHPHAQVMLATFYAEGLGVPQNKRLAQKWARLALLSTGSPVSDPEQFPSSSGDEPKVDSLLGSGPTSTSKISAGTEATDSRRQQNAGNPASSEQAQKDVIPIGFGRVQTLHHQRPYIQDPFLEPASYPEPEP